MADYLNPFNGHTATTGDDTTHWSCNCGAEGDQPDDQLAKIAAQQHIRHPDRTPNAI